MNAPAINDLSHIPKSGIRAISQDAPPGTISLALGEPSWPPLDLPNSNWGHPGFREAKEKIGDTPNPQLEKGRALSYGPNAGLAQLRKAVGVRYGVSPDSVLISQGAQGALFSALSCLVAKGDHVLLPDPGFPGYNQLVALCGGRGMSYRSHGVDSVYESIVSATKGLNIKLIVLNHPSNPTGRHLSIEEFERILFWANQQGIWVISDEVYRHVSCQIINSQEEKWSYPNLVRISSVSKSCAGAGLRIGWAIANDEVISKLTVLHALSSTAASSYNQLIALQMLQSWEIQTQNTREQLARRWHTLARACAQHWRWVPNQPRFGFYLWLKLPSENDFDFCHWIKNKMKVLLVPGSAFGSSGVGYCRLSFAPEPEIIETAVSRLKDVFKV